MITVEALTSTSTEAALLPLYGRDVRRDLDHSWATRDLDVEFFGQVWSKLRRRAWASEACARAVVHVAKTYAHRDGQLGTSYGQNLLEHFVMRSQTIEAKAGRGGLSPEDRFALVEATMVAGIQNRWTPATWKATSAMHRDRVNEVIATRPSRHFPTSRWREALAHCLTSKQASAGVLRDLAFTVVWCGYLEPSQGPLHDGDLAKLLDVRREPIVRARREVLCWLSMIHELLPEPVHA